MEDEISRLAREAAEDIGSVLSDMPRLPGEAGPVLAELGVPALGFDLETAAALNEAIILAVAGGVRPPGNMSKPETIAAWEAEKRPALIEQALAKTSLSPLTGHIVSISFALNRDSPVTSAAPGYSVKAERELLLWFMGELQRMFGATHRLKPLLYGHYVRKFDIPFLWNRCVAHRIPLPFWFPRPDQLRPFNDHRVYDTYTAAGQGSMDALCLAYGLPVKGEEFSDDEEAVDGSKITELARAGRWADITRYNEADVRRGRAIFFAQHFIEPLIDDITLLGVPL